MSHDLSALPRPTEAEGAAEPARLPLGDQMARNPLGIATIVLVGWIHLFAVLAFTQPFHGAYLPVMVGIYLWTGLSVTLYLHRTLTHRGLELREPLRFIGALGASVGLAGDPVTWVGFHRHHHRHSDTPEDVHSPRRGFWYAQGNFLHKITPDIRDRLRGLAKDVRQDAYCRWMEHPGVYIVPHLIVVAALAWWHGLGAVCWCLYLPVMVMFHASQSVNSICHMPRFGYRTFETGDDSRNVPWLWLFTLGECFHNNHHDQPRRAQHGLTWREPDLTKGLIWLLERLGLARNIAW